MNLLVTMLLSSQFNPFSNQTVTVTAVLHSRPVAYLCTVLHIALD